MAAQIIPFRRPVANEGDPRLLPGVPAFDPSNPAHLRAWEAMFAAGKQFLKCRH